MSSPPIAMYALALGVTLVTELPVVWLGVRRPAAAAGRGIGWIVAVFVATHLFSHGGLWWLWHSLPGGYGMQLVVGESGVTLLEAAAYRLLLPNVGWPRALLVSLVANVVSTAVGLSLWWAFGV